MGSAPAAAPVPAAGRAAPADACGGDGAAPGPVAAPPVRVTSVPALWRAAKAAFGGGRTPSDAELTALATVMAGVPLGDLGVAPDDAGAAALARLGLQTPPGSPPRVVSEGNDNNRSPGPSAGRIAYRHIAEDSSLSLGLFLLPAGATIPLHNHPGMTVLSRVLAGRMALRSFDWEGGGEGRAGGGRAPPSPADAAAAPDPWRAAVLVADAVLTPASPPSALRPAAGGNVHAFAAATPVAVLDLLAPPYAPATGRDCEYYEEAAPGVGARRASRAGSRARLRAVPAPAWFVVEHEPYTGVGVDGKNVAAAEKGAS